MKYNTRNQLEKDFGEFPVGHLKHTHLANIKFRVHQSSTAKTIISLLHMKNVIGKFFNGSMSEKLEEIRELDEAKKLKRSWAELADSKLKVMLLSILLILISPILLTIFSILLIKTASDLIGTNKDKRWVNGHVVREYGNNIIVSKRSTQKDRTISHEHIHLLQFHYWDEAHDSTRSNPNLKILIRDESDPFEELKNEGFTNEETDKVISRIPDYIAYEGALKSLSYLANRFEIEVRLHEVVRFHYLKHNKLPKDPKEFEEMISNWKSRIQPALENKQTKSLEKINNLKKKLDINNSEHLKSIIEEMDKESEKHHFQTDVFHIAYLGSDLELLEQHLNSISNKRFDISQVLLEVLYVCYTNLIEYYGDLEESKRLKSQIMGPNFYNYIYSESH